MKITNRYNPEKVVYEDDKVTMKESVEAAVKNGANLDHANLTRANLTRANLTRANLTHANLTDADLTHANLTDAYLNRANLTDAYLTGAYLNRANLTSANLTRANLTHANLNHANLTDANLNRVNLTGAYLTRANLTRANLNRANLTGAYLTRANLTGAYLTDAKISAFSHCPEVGSFVAFKRLSGDRIAVLEIPEDAKRTSSLVGRKCRAEFAKVVRIESLNGTEQFHSGVSIHDHKFVYEVGLIVRPDGYNDDIRIECASGIHFFITRQEAVDYA